MNKNLIFGLILTLALCLCGAAAAESDEAIIDIAGSERYTEEELTSAVETVLAEFDTWEGCDMHIIFYAGDEQSMDALEGANKMERGTFDECAVLFTAFRSPKEAYGAWSADEEYFYSWTLGRAEKGAWNLVNWGWDQNYLKSDQFTAEELDAGVSVIMDEMAKMEGTRFLYAKYAGDEFSSSELEYVNSLERGTFDECAVFYVWFMSPKEAYGAWEPDTLYNWSFYLARADKGAWQLVTYGN